MQSETVERTILSTFRHHKRENGEPIPLFVIYEDCRPRAVSANDVDSALDGMIERGLLKFGGGACLCLTEEGKARLS